jgi:hypothetical protein
MSFDLGSLGQIGQITKMFDPGNLVKQVVNGVLPKNMAVVGDAAGAIVDLKTGNLLGAAQLGMDAMKDLPQATKAQQQQQEASKCGGHGSATASNNPNLDPTPPPNTGKPLEMNQLMDLLNKLLEMFGKKQSAPPSGVFALAEQVKKNMSERTKAGSEQSSQGTSTTTTTTTTTHHRTESAPQAAVDHARHVVDAAIGEAQQAAVSHARREPSAWHGEPATPPPPTSSGWRGSAATPTTTTAPAAPSSAPATPPTNTAVPSGPPPAPTPVADPAASSAGPSNGQTISSLAQFNSMTDAAVRDAVIHGRISPDLAKDQTAMMAIQQRMNSISEMNNLMTNMMRALHDMQMAVVQNIRI